MSTTPTERRLAITPGTWKGTLRYGQLTVVSGDSPVVQSIYGRSPKEAEANATLIADAGTTYNACGLTPSELLAELTKLRSERDELVGALRAVDGHLRDTFPPYAPGESPFDRVREVLAKHKTE